MGSSVGVGAAVTLNKTGGRKPMVDGSLTGGPGNLTAKRLGRARASASCPSSRGPYVDRFVQMSSPTGA